MVEKSVCQQLEEIKTLSDRSRAYHLLLHLQRLSADDASAMESVGLFSSSLLPTILTDSYSADEETAALAIKCLGFMLYHPSIITTLSDEMVQLALDSIVKLIITTPMKTVCNLGVWCLSVQQLNASVIKSRTSCLVNAVTYSLDNPFGSLSVTYEATQAVMKLTSQLPIEMKHMSEMWVPPIYKRLLRSNKTEYDMADRCLHKLSSVILPPQILLSKQVASDLRRNMLECMINMVHDDHKKIQTIKSWGWFISLIGLDSSESKHLINKMLKILEKTFTDPNPQVQIASLVSWRHLIGSLEPQITNYTNKILSENLLAPLIKKIKLILVPLKVIISSKCNLAVYACCLNTWLYLLHKLNVLINQPLVLETAFGSILEVIFSIGFDMPLYNSCIDLFHEYILTNITKNGSNEDESLVEYPIKWLPWDITHLDFNLKIIGFITNVEKLKDKSSDNIVLAFKAGLKIFKSLLKGVRNEVNSSKASDNMIYNCIKSIIKFIREIYEANLYNDYSLKVCLKFIKVVCEELETPVVNSQLYKMSLDIDYIKEIQNIKTLNSPKISCLGVRDIFYMDIVSPMEYLTIIYFSTVTRIIKEISEEDLIFLNLKFEFVVSLFYMEIKRSNNERFNLLRIWNYLAKGLKIHINHIQRQDSGNYTCNIVHHFLIYPLILFISSENTCNALEIELVIEVYKTLSEYLHHDKDTNFFEGLCEIWLSVINENKCLIHVSKSQNIAIFSIFSEIIIQMLENQDVSNSNKECSAIKNLLMLVSRYLKLFVVNLKSNSHDEHTITSKVFVALAGLVARFVLRKDILLFFEVLSEPLSEVMLSCTSMYGSMNQSLKQNLANLWTHVLYCLKRNQQLIPLDSSLFKTHSSLFQTALDHPHLPISNATSDFFKPVSYSDKLSPHNALSYENFEVLSERFGVSPVKKCELRKKAIEEEEETGFINISLGLKRKTLKITKYKTKAKGSEICKSYGHLIGSVSNSRISINHRLESKDIRKPEDILQMLKRK